MNAFYKSHPELTDFVERKKAISHAKILFFDIGQRSKSCEQEICEDPETHGER